MSRLTPRLACISLLQADALCSAVSHDSCITATFITPLAQYTFCCFTARAAYKFSALNGGKFPSHRWACSADKCRSINCRRLEWKLVKTSRSAQRSALVAAHGSPSARPFTPSIWVYAALDNFGPALYKTNLLPLHLMKKEVVILQILVRCICFKAV